MPDKVRKHTLVAAANNNETVSFGLKRIAYYFVLFRAL